jgi:hypothetical protein
VGASIYGAQERHAWQSLADYQMTPELEVERCPTVTGLRVRRPAKLLIVALLPTWNFS